MFPSWDSLSDIQSFVGRLNLLTVCLACLAAPLPFVGAIQYVYNRRATTLQKQVDADSLREKEELKRQVVDLRQNADSNERHFTARADLLDEEARSRLVARLRTLPPGNIGLQLYTTDRESEELSDLIRQSFTKANCKITRVELYPPGNEAFEYGVVIEDNGERSSDLTTALYETLTETGIPDLQIRRYPMKVESTTSQGLTRLPNLNVQVLKAGKADVTLIVGARDAWKR